MDDTGWAHVQKHTKKTIHDSWRARPSDSSDWRKPRSDAIKPAVADMNRPDIKQTTQKRSRSKSRSKSPGRNTGAVSLYTSTGTGSGSYNTTDGQTVSFSVSGEATRFLYPYIEYYQYVPYSGTSIYKWNTRIQTVLSQFNQSDRTNSHPWIIPVGRTLTTYQSAHLALLDEMKKMPSFDSLYVCGIAYRDAKGIIPDIQLTLTGTVDGQDTPAKTAQKELAEEMGLDAAISSFQSVPNATPRQHLFIVQARQCTARTSSSTAAKKAGVPVRGKKDKVIVAVVGNLTELHSLLSTHRNRATADNELDLANIDGVILTKATDVENMYK